MKDGNDLNSVRQFSIEQPVRKRSDFATADRFLIITVKLWILPNASGSLSNRLNKLFSNSRFLLFIKTSCIP